MSHHTDGLTTTKHGNIQETYNIFLYPEQLNSAGEYTKSKFINYRHGNDCQECADNIQEMFSEYDIHSSDCMKNIVEKYCLTENFLQEWAYELTKYGYNPNDGLRLSALPLIVRKYRAVEDPFYDNYAGKTSQPLMAVKKSFRLIRNQRTQKLALDLLKPAYQKKFIKNNSPNSREDILKTLETAYYELLVDGDEEGRHTRNISRVKGQKFLDENISSRWVLELTNDKEFLSLNPNELLKTDAHIRHPAWVMSQDRIHTSGYAPNNQTGWPYVHPDSVSTKTNKLVYELLSLQGDDYSCYICRENYAGCIDHNHVTGEIRGIICGRCNTELGSGLRLPSGVTYFRYINNPPLAGKGYMYPKAPSALIRERAEGARIIYKELARALL